MASVIDQFHNLIGDDVAERDRVRNWRSRLDRMSQWLATRADAIDQLFVPAPTFNHPGGDVASGFEVKIASKRGDVFYMFIARSHCVLTVKD